MFTSLIRLGSFFFLVSDVTHVIRDILNGRLRSYFNPKQLHGINLMSQAKAPFYSSKTSLTYYQQNIYLSVDNFANFGTQTCYLDLDLNPVPVFNLVFLQNKIFLRKRIAIIGTKSLQNIIGRAKIIWQPWSQLDSSDNIYYFNSIQIECALLDGCQPRWQWWLGL